MRRLGAVAAVLGLVAVGVLGLGGIAGAGKPAMVEQGGGPILFDFDVAPKALPSRGAAPARLSLLQRADTASGVHPPALKELQIDLDRNVKLDSGGIPTCRSGPQYSIRRPPEWYEQRCRDAQVGYGLVGVEVQFADQPPFTTMSRIHVYNGGSRDGKLTLYFFMYFEAPITGAVVATAKVAPHRAGRYRQRLVAAFPKIANGAGSITDLRMVLGKRIVSAGCTDGRLQFDGSARFYDDERTDRSTVKRTCRPQDQTKRHSSHRRRHL